MGFVYIISQVRLMKVYLELLLVKCLALWLNFSPPGSKIFPCKVFARECLPSTSPRYLGAVGGAGWKHPHFTQKETKAQRQYILCPKSQSQCCQANPCLHDTGLLVNGSSDCPENINLNIRGFPAWGPACLQGGDGALGWARAMLSLN